MFEDRIYLERVSSNKTEALFLGLTLFFFVSGAWRFQAAGLTFLSILFFGLTALFLFYSLNYRTLAIRLTKERVELRFGVFTWEVPMGNIESCILDTFSLWRIGGAGIHFSSFKGRYRAMFNFLEHPRVVISLKKKKGPVQVFAFSTRYPEQVIEFIHDVLSAQDTA